MSTEYYTYTVTITKDKIKEWLKGDEQEFKKELDKLVEQMLTEYNSELVLKYLQSKQNI